MFLAKSWAQNEGTRRRGVIPEICSSSTCLKAALLLTVGVRLLSAESGMNFSQRVPGVAAAGYG